MKPTKTAISPSFLLMNHPIISYISISLVWSDGLWLLLSPAFQQHFGLDLKTELMWFALMGPAISAILLSYLLSSKNGLSQLFSQYLIWRFNLLYYFLIVLSPILLTAIALELNLLISHEHLPNFWQLYQNATTPLLKAPKEYILPETIILYGFCEELGWRGFMLPQLLKGYSPFKATFFLSVIWFLWHLPLILYTPNSEINLINLLTYFLHIFSISVMYTGLFIQTRGSLLATSIFHGMLNSISLFTPTLNSTMGQGPDPITAMVEGFAALTIILLMSSQFFKKQEYKFSFFTNCCRRRKDSLEISETISGSQSKLRHE